MNSFKRFQYHQLFCFLSLEFVFVFKVHRSITRNGWVFVISHQRRNNTSANDIYKYDILIEYFEIIAIYKCLRYFCQRSETICLQFILSTQIFEFIWNLQWYYSFIQGWYSREVFEVWMFLTSKDLVYVFSFSVINFHFFSTCQPWPY